MKWLKARIKRFIIDAIIEDYRNNGPTRGLLLNGMGVTIVRGRVEAGNIFAKVKNG